MSKILYKIKKRLNKTILKRLLPIYHYLWGQFSAMFYGNASKKIIVIGITGTTGKTTSAYIMAQMLRNCGFKTGYTSTAMFSDGKKDWLNNKKMTMMGRGFTQRMLAKMVKNNCQYAIIETTSEGIRQFRHKAINYDILIFTGLYPEHIESHGSFNKYKEAKQKLFKHLKTCLTKYTDEENRVILKASKLKKLELNKVKKTIIANGDDQHTVDFLKFWAEEKIVYTKHNKEDLLKILEDSYPKAEKEVSILTYSNILVTVLGTNFKVDNKEVNLKLLGEFNALNSLNSIALGINRGIEWEKIINGLAKVDNIPGRLEQINVGQKFLAIIDYAFEPMAVTKLYETMELIREHPNIGKNGNIIHVLGSAGGGRDKSRRSKLGKIAGQNADYVIVTNEDPYDEDILTIIKQVAEGAEKVGKKNGENLFLIMDRREAISKAICIAKPGDIVLFTGKGSEQVICLANGQKKKWDERKVVREELEKSLI
jgi:UDP-N-acetylmuramoyl-L-alanyl-D-glutamate--2,6-diaminopimelate ligase